MFPSCNLADPIKVKLSKLCELCHSRKAILKRPKNLQKICKLCFYHVFESEIHNTIVSKKLFNPGERVAIGASGGKDSTVLIYVLKLLNERYNYGIDLVLLSIDEGIAGYRDDSLATVKRNQVQYDLPLKIFSYKDLYNWTMDEVVDYSGVRSSCTYCGVLRRQALAKGAMILGVNHVVTGHNANDIAETVLMNILRGDVARLESSTQIMNQGGGSSVKRSKPFKYMYQKEIVLYAHYKKLDYFSTECTYAPQAFRGTTRELIKNLEAVRPSCIIDIIYSGEALVLKPKNLKRTQPTKHVGVGADGSVSLERNTEFLNENSCEKCGYLSTNRICNACILLKGLEQNRAKLSIETDISAHPVIKPSTTLESPQFGHST